MKPRSLAIVVSVLVVGVFGFWIWSKTGGGPSTTADQDAAGERVAPQVPPANEAPAPSVPSVPPDSTVQPGGAQPSTPARITSSVVPGMPLVRSGTTPPAAPPPVAAPGRAPASRPEVEPEGRAQMEGVTFMLRDYRTRMGENPVGTNAEIMKAVMGGNPVKARLGPPEGQGLNEQGELVDRWGTPYFFHQMSKEKMEIRSAGPDRKLWTSDDIVGQ